MKFKKLSAPQKYIIFSIPILFLISSAFHFIYEISNQNILVGMFAPVNESVWEHCKMVILPIITCWTFYYILKKDTEDIDKDKWFLGCLISLITSIISIIMLFYFYTSAFGTEILIVDIGILFFAILFGQLLGLHFYNYSKGINYVISVTSILFIVILFIIFTFNPPKIPLFIDTTNNTYGIP